MNELGMYSSRRKHLWFEGPNYTADAVIIHIATQSILLILRKDRQEWALPGGFVDQGESPLVAARREAFEETHATVEDGILVYQGVVDDPRNNEIAWIETSAFLFTPEHQLKVKAGDDAEATSWKKLDELPELYASHAHIVTRALEHLS